jgi:hypothetical protein
MLNLETLIVVECPLDLSENSRANRPNGTGKHNPVALCRRLILHKRPPSVTLVLTIFGPGILNFRSLPSLKGLPNRKADRRGVNLQRN